MFSRTFLPSQGGEVEIIDLLKAMHFRTSRFFFEQSLFCLQIFLADELGVGRLKLRANKKVRKHKKETNNKEEH